VTVEVLIFGSAAQAVKSDRMVVEVGEAATAREVLVALAENRPELRFAVVSARLAVNQAFAAPELRIEPGDELALISLVGGG